MPQSRSTNAADPVVAAIEEVLAAERAAEQKLDDFRRAAEATLTAARSQAADIARRTDARISRVHAAFMERIQAEAARLSPPADSPRDGDAPPSLPSIANAARRLAGRITSDASE